MAIQGFVVFPRHIRFLQHLCALRFCQRPQLTAGRPDQGALNNARHALLLQHRGHRFPDADLANGILGREPRVLPIGLCGQFQVFAIPRGKGAQRVLDAIAKLSQNILWNVARALGDEIDANPLGADQPRHLFHLVDQGLGRVVKQQMRLIKEEHQPGLVRIAHLGQFFKQLAQQPQQEGGIKLGRRHQFVRGKDIDHAAPGAVLSHQIAQRQRRLTKQIRAALVFQHQQTPLDGPHRGRRDIAIAQ